MNYPIEPYLALVQKELATSLMPEDDNARRIATYAHRVLTQLLLQSTTVPALEHKAISQLDTLLDELNGMLRAIDGAMVLTGELMQHIRHKPDYAALEPALQRAVKVLLANPNPAGKQLLQKITAILQDKQDALHTATLAQQVEPSSKQANDAPPLSDAQQAALQTYLRNKFAEPALQIGAIKAITGGGSKKTLIVNLLHTKQLPAAIVVRADHAGGVVESTVSDEYQLIETIYAAGLPVPQPFASETDTSIIGAPFVVVSCLEGTNIGDHIDVYTPTKAFGQGIARAMGKLHAIPPEKFGDKIVGAKTSTLERVRQDIASFEGVWRNSGVPSVALEMAYAWLKDHMHFAEGRRALNHCDLACHNMLAKNGELTAILDWETTIIGNPAHDLAYIYVQAVQTMPWEEFLAEYVKAGGTAPSVAEFDFYRLWTTCWRISFLHIARSFFHSGISPSVVLAYGAQHLRERCEYELHRILNDIYQRY